MQTDSLNATQNANLKIKYANQTTYARQMTKQDKLLKGRDGQDGAHVGATSPSLGVSTTW
jgi:hypothetical protein